MSADTAQVPPQDTEAERQVLGGLLVSAAGLPDDLRPEHFYRKGHGRIFAAIADLAANGVVGDETAVAAELERRGEMTEDGRRYLSELAATAKAPGNAAHHGETVLRLHRERRRIEFGRRLIDPNFNGDGPELLAELGAIVEGTTSGRGLEHRPADLSRVRPIRWLWHHRILLGYLSLLLGAEGIGKGTVTAWIIARITNGELPGDLSKKPGRVLLVGDEDAFDSVVVPRLYAAGADLELVDTLSDADGDALDIRADADRLAGLVREREYRLVYIDALLDVLGVDVDDWRSKAVRDALRPLRRVARDTDVAILASLHPNKGARGNFRDLISGSHAFNASSRSSLLLAQHPEDENRRILVRGKGNLSAPPPAFEFAIEGRDLEINGHMFSLPVVADPKESELGVEDVVKPQREAPLRESLADKINALGTGEIQSRADIARALDREPDDRSIGRALEQLEDQGRWEKVGRGKWRVLALAPLKGGPMSKCPEEGEST